jgi:hypothetical protein
MPASRQQSGARDLRPANQSSESVADKSKQHLSSDHGSLGGSDACDSSAGREIGIDSSASYSAFGSGLDAQDSCGSFIGATSGTKSDCESFTSSLSFGCELGLPFAVSSGVNDNFSKPTECGLSSSSQQVRHAVFNACHSLCQRIRGCQ